MKLDLYSSFSVRDQVSHPYKITIKLTFLDNRFRTEWQQAFPAFALLSASSCILFSFISVVPATLCGSLHKDMARLRVADGGDGLQTWSVAANILSSRASQQGVILQLGVLARG